MILSPELIAILVQAAGVIFVAGRGWSRLEFLDRRLAAIERQQEERDKAGTEIGARLARIEEKLNQLTRNNGRRT